MNGVGLLPHPNGGRLDLDLPANAATKVPDVIGLAGKEKAATFENIPTLKRKLWSAIGSDNFFRSQLLSYCSACSCAGTFAVLLQKQKARGPLELGPEDKCLVLSW
jgi:hypothetical protein